MDEHESRYNGNQYKTKLANNRIICGVAEIAIAEAGFTFTVFILFAKFLTLYEKKITRIYIIGEDEHLECLAIRRIRCALRIYRTIRP